VTRCDALVVGGGPAGSTCARVLTRAGLDVLVIDRARFPRDKVCAGWVTPGVFRLLELDPAEYRAAGLSIQEITGFRTSVIGRPAVETRYPHVVSYAIRRCEFDDFLLRRAGARVRSEMPLSSLERRDGRWIANGGIETPLVIGAGGHFCPVARSLAGGSAGDSAERNPPSSGSIGGSAGRSAERNPPQVRLVVAKEAEYRLEAGGSEVAGDTPELFFCHDLEGYGWCVRKDEYLNVGLGRRDHGDLNAHLRDFIGHLERHGLARRASLVRWCGHAYLASGTGPRPLISDGVLLAGDSAGLAYPESGEGIKPAVESGRLAADAVIAANGRYEREELAPYETALRRGHPAVRGTPPALAGAVKALGRGLMRSPVFTRRVLIDRWFLRA
jgi:flavin-dependent dehydrogenase